GSVRQTRRRCADPRSRTRESARAESRQRPSRLATAVVARPESDRRLARVAGAPEERHNRPEAQLAIARQQLLSNDAPGARKSLEQALALKPDYLPAALTLSQMGPEERQEGISSLERYVQQNPKSHDARLALAQMYLASDRLDDAQKQFEIMHKANANDLTPIMALAL